MWTSTAVATLRAGSRIGIRPSSSPTLLRRVSFSSSTPPPSKQRSLVWQAATFAVVGTTFVVVGNYFSDSSWRYDEDAAANGPIKPCQAEISSKVYLDVAIDSQPMGRIVLGLHGTVVPKTVQNFETICRGGTKVGNIDMTYRDTKFHRIIPGFMIQAGETPGRSIFTNIHFDGRFQDENFQLKHVGPGILSMANAGKDTNGSQFFITTQRTTHLDGKHVVFGVVLEGWDLVKDIEACGSRSGRPRLPVVVTGCGVLEDGIE